MPTRKLSPAEARRVEIAHDEEGDERLWAVLVVTAPLRLGPGAGGVGGVVPPPAASIPTRSPRGGAAAAADRGPRKKTGLFPQQVGKREIKLKIVTYITLI